MHVFDSFVKAPDQREISFFMQVSDEYVRDWVLHRNRREQRMWFFFILPEETHF